MNTLVWRSALLRKYILYNVCFLLIPVLVMASLYFQTIEAQLLREYESTYGYALNQTVQSTDMLFETMVRVANQISNDGLLTPYRLRSNTYDAVSAQHRLGIYYSQLGFLEDILLYLDADDVLYSSSGKYSLDAFSGTAYRFVGPWEKEDLSAMLRGRQGNSTSPAGCFIQRSPTSAPLMVIGQPWALSTGGRFGTIICLIKSNAITGTLQMLASELQNASYIVDSTGKIVFQSEASWSLTEEELREVMSSYNGEAVMRVSLRDGAASVMIRTSNQTNWRYVTAFSHSRIAGQLLRDHLMTLCAMAAIMLAAITAGVLLAFTSYLPIQKIATMLTGRSGESGSDSKKKRNELSEIMLSMQNMLSFREEDERKKREERQWMTYSLALQALNGTLDMNNERISDMVSACDFSLGEQAYCVAVVRFDSGASAAYDALLERASALEHTYAVEVPLGACAALIFGCERDGARRFIEARVEPLLAELTRARFIGVSRTVCDIACLPLCLNEAMVALQACGADNSIRYFEQARRADGSDADTESIISKLLQSVRQENDVALEVAVQEVQFTLSATPYSTNAAMSGYLRSGVTREVAKLANELGVEHVDARVLQIVGSARMQDWASALHALCVEAVEASRQRNTQKKKLLYQKLLKYIDEHYMLQDMSLQNMADAFEMPTSSMSRFFSDCVGATFIEYLTRKRMDRACELLKTTNMKIRDVMEQVGYIDPSNFSRKFAQIYGVSPKQYRADT